MLQKLFDILVTPLNYFPDLLYFVPMNYLLIYLNSQRLRLYQLLLKFDMDVIKAHGLETITPVVLTNTDDLKSVSPVKSGKVTEKDVIISFGK